MAKMNIKLTILGRSYPIAIEREQEEIYRKAEREVNATVTKLKAVSKVEAQDSLAMTALLLGRRKIEMEQSRSLGEDIDALVEIDRQLGAYLENNIR